MSKFVLRPIEAIKGKQAFYEILENGVSQFSGYCQKIRQESQYIPELRTIFANMDMVANNRTLPETKFKNITPKNERVKEFEFKSKHLRVYAFHLEKKGKIVAYGGFKNTQAKDIRKFRALKKRYSDHDNQKRTSKQ